MRCPKCKLITSETNRICPRCGEDLSTLAEAFGPFYKASHQEDLLSLEFLDENSEVELETEPSLPESPLPEIELITEETGPERETQTEPELVLEPPTEEMESGKEGPFEEDFLRELEEVLEEDPQG